MDNQVYIKSEWPLRVVYTLIPYEDPKENGTPYRDYIDVDGSMTVSAKACFLGLKWSELASADIVVGADKLEIVDTDAPGTSIMEITAYLTGSRYFPEQELSAEDIRVEGTTIAEEAVVLEDFTFEPHVLVEGQNEITVRWHNLEFLLTQFVKAPQLVNITANYTGEELREGDALKTEDFQVMGIFDDGNSHELEEFSIEPSEAMETGQLMVTVSAGGFSTEVALDVKEKEYAFTAVNELHTPNGGFDPEVTVITWKEAEDRSIEGKTFENGLKVTFNNWMSNMMGNGTDFSEKVESKLYISVNQDVLAKKPEDEQYLDGYFVVGKETKGSTTTMKITILADGEAVYESDTITAASTNIPPFHISAKGVEEIIIQTNADVHGNPFVLGIAFE